MGVYKQGQILYFEPFYFLNGNTSKNKYFIVLKQVGEEIIVASLPTSKDFVPRFIPKVHGCLKSDEANFCCYYFEQDKPITDNDWAFSRDTYLYAEQIDIYELSLLTEMYKFEGIDYQVVGCLTQMEYQNLTDCVKDSKAIRRKVRRVLDDKI